MYDRVISQIDAIGPRNRRRVMWAAVGLGAVALIVALVWLTRTPNHHPPVAGGHGNARSAPSSGSASAQEAHVPVPNNHYERGHVVGKLAYGMTREQVLRRAGRPVKIIRWQGLPCWQYPINEYSPASGPFPAYTLNAVGACFLDGKYTTARYKIDGKWGYDPLTKRITG